MLITCVPYVVIQGPAFAHPTEKPTNEHHTGLISDESVFALVGLVCCCLLFVGVCIYQLLTGGSKEAQQDIGALVADKQQQALREGLMNFSGMFREHLMPLSPSVPNPGGSGGDNLSTNLMLDDIASDSDGHAGMPRATLSKIKSFLRPIFLRYDVDKSGSIDADECRDLFRDLGERASREELHTIMQTFDKDNNGTICLDEFCQIMIKYARSSHSMVAAEPAVVPPAVVPQPEVGAETADGEDEDEDEEEDEEMPEDLAHLSPMEQQKRCSLLSYVCLCCRRP